MRLGVAGYGDRTAAGEYGLPFGHALFGVVGPFGADIGFEAFYCFVRGKLIENYHVVHARKPCKQFGAFRLAGHRLVHVFKFFQGFVAVYGHSQDRAEFFRFGEAS